MNRPIPILVLLSLAMLVPPAWGRPAYQKALADYYGPFLAAKLNDCRTCHVPAEPGAKDDEEKPHNPFGARLKALKKELAKAGKKTDIITRLQAVADEDSDGDGVPNLLEILAGHYPGEADDKPTEEELAAARKKQDTFLARPYYRWNAFETVQRPAVPQVKNRDWVHNPIDAFLASEHEVRGLTPRPEAPRSLLVRRVYLDLTGLPPTPDELNAAMTDTSSDWYEKIVDRLLTSPRYGERWGRHWMDVWRYADWSGYGAEVRESQEHIWQWRDWIVESLNEDKPYDRMVQEMLAGDELAPEDPRTIRATGFLVRNWHRYTHDTWMEDTVEHTSKAFLGFTMNCARCHNHFFDTSVSQQDYYRLRAIFEPYDVRLDRVPGEPDVKKRALPRVFDAKPNEPTYLYVRGNVGNPDKERPLPPGVPAALGGPAYNVEPVTLPLRAYAPDKRPFVIEQTIAASQATISQAKAALTAARQKAVLAEVPFYTTNGWSAVTQSAVAPQVFIALELAELAVPLVEAKHEALMAVIHAEQLEDAGKKGAAEWQQAATDAQATQRRAAALDARRNLLAAAPKARPEAEKALAKADADARLPPTTEYTHRTIAIYPTTSTGRRLALARWITDRQNPLAARVAVNHVWLRHFGTALVPTVFDFGQNGQPPTHPALLDWLAVELMEPSGASSPWSMKHLHRLIVTSSAYRMSSTGDRNSAAIDRDNRYLWRMNAHRMEAELVRDSALFLGGQLEFAMGGPEVPYTQGLTSHRRSIYLQHAAEKQAEFLSLFDAANITECYQRSESIIPQQALALVNSPLTLSQSRLLAGQLTKRTADDGAFIKELFIQVLSRAPSAQEQTECEKFVAEQAGLLMEKKLTRFEGGTAAAVPPSTEPRQRARESLVLVLLNHNDFVMIR